MPSFKEFLNQQQNNHGFDLEKFKKDCKPYLDMIGRFEGPLKILNHGTKRYNTYFSIQTWKERERPKDTPLDIHDATNKFFIKKLGAPIRNWLFCNGSTNTAATYGNGIAQAIFPIGDFKLFCSPQVYDFTEIYGDVRHNVTGGVGEADVETEKKIEEELVKLLNSITWLDEHHLEAALNSRCEIMIKCDKFYQINRDEIIFTEIVKPYIDSI